LSFYAKATDNLTNALSITLTPRDGGSPTVGEVIASRDLTTEWQRYSVTTYIDADDVLTSLDFEVVVEVDSATGESIYLDNFQLEASPVATDPFDGNLSSQFGVVWEGTANESPSHMYSGNILKVRIETYDGVEYTNLSI
jgi:hypothetical protein